ncbi:hypothetical protein R70723_05400 [Paenibacillus sp. FSL R7-0273]|uniref:hypothetical protein n=1 Tax=Paenibacillus sp. FSL R7-0273 TaxID=1536772 RepID=UPI0004F6DB3E|nr:hypothetical protein [Paenibacillus sp. FSL R7-0273]AIQ45395.1 hypothetical protein R70723_05400 [Paenibacillus sp. FSL R7-0273]OMF89977.1 hypothetical protein BK144_18490 [Paenibacillus sp. FSL R7-0273]
MSEFTSGHILRAADRDIVRKHAVRGSVMIQLNEQYIAYLIEHTYNSGLAQEHIQLLSEEAPVLYFYNFADHEWGYQLIHQGKEIAALHIAYEYEEEMVLHTAEERYPESDLTELLLSGTLEKIREELESASVFEQKLGNLFNDSRPEQFQLLGASGEQVVQLCEILSHSFIHRNINQAMELSGKFIEILGIEEMSCIRHERVVESEEYDELF